jgi:hypothetical protein
MLRENAVEEAGEYDITIEQSSGFTLPLRYEILEGSPVDFTGSTARMQVRRVCCVPRARRVPVGAG